MTALPHRPIRSFQVQRAECHTSATAGPLGLLLKEPPQLGKLALLLGDPLL